MSEIKKIVYQPNYEGLKIHEVAYGTTENCYGKMQEYSLDIITSENDSEVKLRPVVIYVHGGGFMQPRDKRQSDVSLICRHFIAQGYIAVSPDYPIYDNVDDKENDKRAAVPTKPPAAIKLAYDFIVKHAEEYGFDTKRIAIMGSSAGSTTVYNTITNYKELEFACFCALWGIPPEVPDVSHFPPIFSVHGTNDLSFVREKFVTAAFADAHISRTLITLGGSGHSPLNRMDEYLPEMLDFVNFHINAIK